MGTADLADMCAFSAARWELTTDELPGTVIVSVQAQAAVGSSPDKLCIHLSQEDARLLHGALIACLKGTTN